MSEHHPLSRSSAGIQHDMRNGSPEFITSYTELPSFHPSEVSLLRRAYHRAAGETTPPASLFDGIPDRIEPGTPQAKPFTRRQRILIALYFFLCICALAWAGNRGL